ncbi:putative spermidine/putrescine transport system ATP-binding protein [Variovorax sp. HW608]|uniref:ABC transporter ATP-binding protein n=1 Tax=Variovorax sp. HW608 TaxID=1034889 RepID=UPI00081FF3A7|nr:ABC transporter ATP-binding protein [Variovorax sp. HW608]SCK08612.1 putative spermidine/putrescine transport system ATP-binding protein [Variovorax sp. HW608]
MLKGESLRLERLSKLYGSARAVDEVSVQIEAGEFVSFLGPSGSGKTSTLMMVAGFETPTAGKIFVGDRPITGLPVHKRNIGVVFQNYALFPHLSVFENVAFALKMRGMSGSELRAGVKEALSLVQLGGYEGRMPHELSGGQQQRVALARALVFRPGVVLMDEPLGALDKQLREHMQVELKRLQKSLGTTMVFVTHDQSEALTMSDRIVVMNNGKVEQVGSPEEIYEAPRTRFVASFIGESNFLDARLIGEADNAPLLDVGGLQVCATWQGVEDRAASMTLMIRPEKVIPLVHGARADNEFDAVVEDAVYWGNVVKYRVCLRAASPVHVTVAVQRHALAPTMQIGETVRVGWNARDGRLLCDDSQSASASQVESPQAESASLHRSVAANRIPTLNS